VLNIQGLTGGWGPTVIIEGIDLFLGEGETLAVIGRNGVGKTTLMELISGRARRQAGNIFLHEADLAKLPPHKRAHLGVGHVPQEREVFKSLTVEEHLQIAARPGEWTRARVLDLFPSLAARLGSLGSQLSGGEQQMLAIARAMVGNPCLLMMDEPSEGLAPVVIDQMVAAMKALTADKSLSILLVEQRIDIAQELADRFVVIDRGRIAHAGAIGELDASESLAELVGLTHG
jgi:ABC-type branched-chain amino acid transport systems, ATPase component